MKFEKPIENLKIKMAQLSDEELLATFREYQEKFDGDVKDGDLYEIRSAAVEEMVSRWGSKKINLEMALAEKVSGEEWKKYEKIKNPQEQTKKLMELALQNNVNPEEV